MSILEYVRVLTFPSPPLWEVVTLKVYFTIVQPNLAYHLCLLGIPGFTILLLRGGINP